MKPIGDAPILSMTEVTKSYRSGDSLFSTSGDRVVALDQMSLDINAGEIFGLVGESGSGKTTASRLIVGLEMPDQGGSDLMGRILWESKGERERTSPKKSR
jgi:ABC-type glutathione transport system ATPase component